MFCICNFFRFQIPQNFHGFYFVSTTFHSFKFRKTFTFLFCFQNFSRFQIPTNFHVSVQFPQLLSVSNSEKISRLCFISVIFFGFKFRKTFTFLFSLCNFSRFQIPTNFHVSFLFLQLFSVSNSETNFHVSSLKILQTKRDAKDQMLNFKNLILNYQIVFF